MNFPRTFESQSANEELEPFNARITFASPQRLSATLQKNGPLRIRSASSIATSSEISGSSTIFQQSVRTLNSSTTTEDPAILVEWGASFCSLLLTSDAEGNCVTRHDPLTYDEDDAIDKKLDNYFVATTGRVNGSDSFVLITGTNSQDGKDSYQRKITERVKENRIRKSNFSNQKVVSSFIRAAESIYTEAKGKFASLRRKLSKVAYNSRLTRESDAGFPPTTREISGLIFVPLQLSTTGKSEIMLLTHDSDLLGIQRMLFPQDK